MIKNSVVALVAAAALAGVAVPAMAAPEPVKETVTSSEIETPAFNSDYVLYQLQAKGVNATAVEEWGSYVRAYVIGQDGRRVMQFFDPDTLVQVNI